MQRRSQFQIRGTFEIFDISLYTVCIVKHSTLFNELINITYISLYVILRVGHHCK